jgi:hypothetical protein
MNTSNPNAIRCCHSGCSRRQFILSTAGTLVLSTLANYGKTITEDDKLSELQLKNKIRVGKFMLAIQIRAGLWRL